MLHHVKKAVEVYQRNGAVDMITSAFRYLPIEINNLIFKLQNEKPTHIMQEDWDNLIILDACRYDLFKQHIHSSDIEGHLESRISLGSSSEEFLEQNFVGQEFYDTVYVNSNPYVPLLDLTTGTFHDVIDCLEEWDDNIQTVPPESVSNAGKKAANKYPNKRLIIHFMQPHHPFLGETGRSMSAGGGSITPLEPENVIWEQLEQDTVDVDIKTVWQAYGENLQLVLSEVKNLIDTVDGRTVITADHGNLVGESLDPIPTSSKYGHPYGVYAEELVRVPWFIIESEHRRQIQSDPPVEHTEQSNKDLNQKLRYLGYR